ncbi:MAG: putative bifunctional diguanylate cyclase/phosphodiesterase [Steroidobacteraceae bacterium]
MADALRQKTPACLTCIAGGLARRTFLMFVLCAMLPLTLTGLITVKETAAQLAEQTIRNLGTAAKDYSLQLFERLSLAQHVLINAQLQDTGLLTNTSIGDDYNQYFDAIELIDATTHELLSGNPQRMPHNIDPATISQKQGLWIHKDQNGIFTVYLAHRPQQGAGLSPLIVAALNHDYLWQPTKQSGLYELCVKDSQGTTLYCAEADGSGTDIDAKPEYLSSGWSLFLNAGFGVSDWNISARQLESVALASVVSYKRTLLSAISLTLAFVALLSSITIRRSHRPLEQMIAATRQIADGQFDQSLDVNSGDEYEELAQAFNSMGSQLSRQFRTLSALSEIDRHILASPNLEPVLETMLVRTRGILTCNLAAIALFDTETETLGRLYVIDENNTGAPTLNRMKLISANLLHNGSDWDGYIIHSHDAGSAVLQPVWRQNVQKCLLMPVNTKTRMRAMIIMGYGAGQTIEMEQRQVARDLTDRLAVALTSVEREQTLFHQAHYDSLTLLPNRLLFKDRLEPEIALARRDSSGLALLFLDLDRYKNINDSLGHSVGDHLLQMAATRFKTHLREVDTIARLGGDEFTIIVPQVNQVSDLSKLCERILHSLKQPFVIDGHEHIIGTSIGIAIYPHSGTNAEELLRNADTAMYRAKEVARGSYAFYEEKMNQELKERIQLEKQLRQALAQEELTLYFQPQIDLASGKIIGAEALLRWQHPDHGMISPERFIPIAEETGLIVPMGDWVMRRACAEFNNWRAQGLMLKSISVNVAVPQLHSPEFVEKVTALLDSYQLKPGTLELEVTESTLATDMDKTIEILTQLSNSGVRLAIDDFGTGYSSLSYLQRLPIDVLKIDRAFMPQKFDGKDQVICDAVLALAHALNKTVIAEGVENAEQMLYLQHHGCQIGQGYFFGRPVTSEEFSGRLLSHQTQVRTQDSMAL